MSKSNLECEICLELFYKKSRLGIIENCQHYYHKDCIEQWSQNSNTCPTCRQLFYRLRITRNFEDRTPIGSIRVQDKLLPNEGINDIPREFVISANSAASNYYNSREFASEEEEAFSSNNTLCSICTDYRGTTANGLIYCNVCTSAFHSLCLGLDQSEETEEFYWICPMCDNNQEYVPDIGSFSRRKKARVRPTKANGRRLHANRFRGRAVDSHNLQSSDYMLSDNECYEHKSPFFLSTGRSSQRKRNTWEDTRQRKGLVVHNENGELDDDFLYHSEDLPYDRHHLQKKLPILNGGVILRKEQKEKAKLTKEEADSWNLFDLAKSGDSLAQNNRDSIKNSVAPHDRDRKKRARRSNASDLNQQEGCSADLNHLYRSQENPSRISNLIGQVRSRNTDNDSKFNLEDVRTAEDQIRQYKPKHYSSEESSLSYEQKVEVQKHVRNLLKPIYKPTSPDNKEQPIIRTEKVYIKVNKLISRKIYQHMLSSATNEKEELNDYTINSYLEKNKSILSKIVDDVVNNELLHKT